MKDSEPPEDKWFDLVIHSVGESNGAALRASGDEATKSIGLGKNQKIAIDALMAVSEPAKGVCVETWKAECLNQGIDRRRIPGLQESLIDSGHISVSGGMVALENQYQEKAG
jgi:hypothetical protein